MDLIAQRIQISSRMDRAFADDPRFEGNHTWWDSDQLFKAPDALFGTRTSYSFSIGSEEVARALICADRSPLRGYSLPVSASTISEVQFLEVRPDWRKAGVGLGVLAQLCNLHRGIVVALALPHAEAFWRKTGWREVAPDDRDSRRSTAYFTVT